MKRSRKHSCVQTYRKKLPIRKGGKQQLLVAEIIENVFEALPAETEACRQSVGQVLEASWGVFDETVVHRIVDGAKWLLLLKHGAQPIAVSVFHKKYLLGHCLYDIDLTALLPEWRGLGLTVAINGLLFRRAYLDNLLTNRALTMEVVFTTANMRVLGAFARLVAFIYPDPYAYDRRTGKIAPADDTTWAIAQEFIRHKYPASVTIQRDGCVVCGSYDEMPWLIYDADTVPRHEEAIVNEFADTYLRYHEASGRKFFVRSRITFLNVIKFVVGAAAYNARKFLNGVTRRSESPG